MKSLAVARVLALSRALTCVRLDKFLADVGAAKSRAASSALIRAGRVHVDGRVERVAKTKVQSSSTVCVDGRAVIETPVPLLLRYHKPLGVHCTMRDDRSRSDLASVVASLPRTWRVHPVGRLDHDTTGLLLFSSRGDLTQKLLHPRHGIEKEYVADCETTVDPEALRSQLAAGVETALGIHTARLIDASNVDGLLRLRLVVSEGKHRMVRRMLANLGAPVRKLRRERFGPVHLGDLSLGDVAAVSDPHILAWAQDDVLAPNLNRQG